MTESTDYIRGWLRGFYDGEGSVRFAPYRNGQGYMQICWEIYAVNTDYDLIQKGVDFLTVLGIPFKINETKMPYHDRKKVLYKIRIGTREGGLKFHELVGFTASWKAARLEGLVGWLRRPKKVRLKKRDSLGRFAPGDRGKEKAWLPYLR